MSTEIIQTGTKKEFTVPSKFTNEFLNILHETQQKFARIISEKYDIEYETIINECIPDDTFYLNKLETRGRKKKNAFSFDDWQTATDKDQLSSLTIKQLKDILVSKNVSTNGNKQALVDKVWGLIDTQDEPVVETQDDDDIIGKCNTMWFSAKGRQVKENSKNSIKYLVHPVKNWVFKETNDGVEFYGYYKNSTVVESDDVPEELAAE